MSLLKIYIRRLVGLCIICLVSRTSNAQLSSPNLIQDEIIGVSNITTDDQAASLSGQSKIITHKFYDGLNRIIQTIDVAASPSGNDIIRYNGYNSVGQATFKYLPYIKTGNSGNYDASCATNQTNFYNNGLIDKVADDAAPWSQEIIESSPQQRIIAKGQNGTGFQPISGQHYKSINYRSNNSSLYTADSYNTGIRIWLSDGTSSGVYPTGSLSVVEVTDESGNVTDMYLDNNKKIILKRQVLSPALTIDNVSENCLDTYYVYDGAGELVNIVPPKAVVTIRIANPTPWNVNLAAASPMIYYFVYDGFGRITQKKVPNAAWMYIVYDPMNRPVLVQDGNRRLANQWIYFKYDIKGRIITQGIYTDATNNTLPLMQAYVSGLASTVYNNYFFEEKTIGGSNPNYYTNRIFPTSNYGGGALQDLLYYYYDNYDFNSDGNPDYSYTTQGLTNEASPIYLNKDQVTAVFKKTLNNDGTLNIWLRQVVFYDKYGNTIQINSNNHTNVSAVDLKTDVSDFMGRVVLSKNIKTVNSITTTIIKKYRYDNFNRLSVIDQSNNGSSFIRISAYTYNEVGKLVTTKMHSSDTINFMQGVDRRYNINGLLTSINNATLTVDNTNYTNSDANDIFGEEILYEKSDPTALGNTGLYSNLISAIKWKDIPPSGNLNERSYKYSYDQLNRLSTANYAEWNTSSSNWSQAVGYNDENVSKYDHNGNIEALVRFSANTKIDDLSYTYTGNQLSNVTDVTGNSLGFNGANSTSYAYDNGGTGNGNLTSDPKKGVTISYNILNRTDKILFTTTNNYIRYTYDIYGNVVRKEVFVSSTSTTTTYDYIDGFVFQNLVLNYLPTEEGRVRSNSGVLTFEYFIKDHQGNVRVSFDGTGGAAVVHQENSYYPFGMILPGNYTPTQPNNKLYNGGSEWQNDFSNAPDLYRTLFRNYDPELGRFISVDPLASEFSSVSPYEYVNNNPVLYIDPTGANLTPAELQTALQEAFDILRSNGYGSGEYTLVSNGQLNVVSANYTGESFIPTAENKISGKYTALYDSKGELIGWEKVYDAITVTPDSKLMAVANESLSITVAVIEIAAIGASDGLLAPLLGADAGIRILNSVNRLGILYVTGSVREMQMQPKNFGEDIGAALYGTGSEGQEIFGEVNDALFILGAGATKSLTKINGGLINDVIEVAEGKGGAAGMMRNTLLATQETLEIGNTGNKYVERSDNKAKE